MKIFIRLLLIISFLISIQKGYALVREKSKTLEKSGHIDAVTFTDYPPFGQKTTGVGVETLYKPFMDMIKETDKQEILITTRSNYKDLIYKVVNGDLDIVLGAYYDTEEYGGLELLYPSVLNNPIACVTLPERDLKILSKKDLQGLKGGIDGREHVSDYVKKELKKLNVQTFNDSEKLYEQLFIGNIDYILTSRYYGALEQAKMGIRDMVQMSKTAIWDMPLFIGVSSINKISKAKSNTVKLFLKKHGEEVREKINALIIETIRQADEKNRGTVPPSFVK